MGAGKSLVAVPGQSPHRLDLEYFCSGAGKLERIVLIREDGSKYTSFSARSKVSMKELAAKLAERIAARTIEALDEEGNRVAPLQAVELSFRSVTNYVPGVIPATEGDSVSNMGIVLAKGQTNWLELNEEDFEPEMAEFLERMNTAENWDPGSRMLRQAAFLVTKLAPREQVADRRRFCVIRNRLGIRRPRTAHDLETVRSHRSDPLKRLRKIGWLNHE